MLPIFADVFKKYEASMHSNGMLPYWPGGGTGQPFVTANAAWAFFEARDGGIPVPESLVERFASVVNDIAEGRIESDSETQTLALMVAARYVDSADSNKAAADSLYLRRDRFSTGARAFLALAFSALKHNPDASAQLLAEIGGEIPDDGFDPRIIRYDEGQNQSELLAGAIAELRVSGFDLSEIVVLSPLANNSVAARTTDSKLRQILRPADGSAPRKGAVTYSTIQAYKGLDSPAVIITDLSDSGMTNFDSLMYTGLTRATDRLIALIETKTLQKLVGGKK
jgi:superfamily I DNA/RNA helicase